MFAETDALVLAVKVHLLTFAPLLLHAPLKIAGRPFETVKVTEEPDGKLLVALAPVATESPAGFDVTRSPERPDTVSVIAAVGGIPHTLGMPAPPQVSVPRQPPQ